MTLAASLENTIRHHRIMAIDAPWADEIVFPYYRGLSIRNLAHTVVRLLDTRYRDARIGSSPLDGQLWAKYQGEIKRVVLFISDGLGWQLLNEIMAEDAATAQIVADLVGDGTLTPITSIAPSTTAAALPCIWTGASPAATGMVGTRLFLREFSMLVSMLWYTPLAGSHRREVLGDWGLDFEKFVPLQTLGEALRQRRIPSYLVLQKDLYASGLSRIMHRGVKHAVRHYGYTDLWITLRDLLRRTRNDRCFVSVYWSAVDGASHLFGTVTEQTINEVRRQLADLRETLLAEGTGDGRTLFMFAADHGHAPIDNTVILGNHAPVYDARRAGPGGEGRFTYLYLRDGLRAQVEDHIAAHLGDQIVTLRPDQALRAGLFGPEDPHPETAARLGDLTLVARHGTSIFEQTPTYTSMSRHGALSAREMLVPLIMRMM